jgi:hypothetical protein
VTAAVLEALEPTTSVTSGPNDTVAGRPAYELVLKPQDAGSLVGSVRIAVDAAELVPTRVQVLPTGSDVPALEVGFTDLSFATPGDDVFEFSPASGVTVEEHSLEGHDGARHHRAPGLAASPGVDAGTAASDRVTVVGEGWSAVVVSRLPEGADVTDLTGAEVLGGDAGAFLQALPRVSGDWGSGRLLTSRLFSALLTDDGRLLVGAVDGDTLRTTAADPAAALG